MLGYNQSGPNDSVSDPNRNEGYLFWLAWLDHNAASVFGDSDANGTLRALTQEANCATLDNEVGGINTAVGLAQAQLLGTLNTLLDNNICGTGAPGGPGVLPITPPSLPSVPVPSVAGRSASARSASTRSAKTPAPLAAIPSGGKIP